jgi:hypothetical protein
LKYTEAWANVVAQNLNLKLVSIILGVLSIVLGMITLRLTFRDSIIIERGCFSKTVLPVKDEHSKEEIEAFLKESLSQRFDSEVQPVDGLLSPNELRLRFVEQKEFDSRKMTQKIIISNVSETPEGFKVGADRLISVGDVRSAFRFPLLVKLESKPRSYSNPYGLLITTTKTIEDKPNDSKEKK